MFKVRRNALYRTDFLFDVKALNNFFILEIKVCSLNTTNIHDVFQGNSEKSLLFN